MKRNKSPSEDICTQTKKVIKEMELGEICAQNCERKAEALIEEPGNKSKEVEQNINDIIKKISKHLRSGIDCKPILTILENISVIYDDISREKEIRLQMVDLFLDHLETSGGDELRILSIEFKKILYQDLRKYMVDDTSLESGSVELGKGDYGIVTLGKLRKSDGSWVQVAVKTAACNRNRKAFIEEANVMTQFDHENVIKLLALQMNSPKIAMEYMEWGSLSNALKHRRFTCVDLLNIIRDIASGMEHIAAKNYVHRDLCLSNILINTMRKCKVGDLGFCKYVGDTDGYYEEKIYSDEIPEGLKDYPLPLPIPPEMRERPLFSTKIDVWMMGLMMWEMYVRAADLSEQLIDDYLALAVISMQFRRSTMIDPLLSKPERCSSTVYTYICNEILRMNPHERPTFTAIKETICDILS